MRTDGRTDMVIPVYPPNFVAGGIIKTPQTKDSLQYNLIQSSQKLGCLIWDNNLIKMPEILTSQDGISSSVP